MKTFTITMAKRKDIDNYYDEINSFFNTVEVEVEANNTDEAIEAVKGYKRMIAWKVDDEIVY